MRKLIACLLAAALLLAVCGGGAEQPARDYDRLTVAVTSPMTGNFFTGRWGNNTSDTDVRALIHGYNLVYWDVANGVFAHDPTVVSGIMATAAPGGDRTYTVVLQPDLVWADGTPITAWDYAFSLLLSLSPEMDALGGTGEKPLWIVGADAWAAGEAGELTGVRVLGEDQLSVTMKGEYFPFFYELALLSCEPAPISVIAPGVRVADQGRGVYLTNADEAVTEPVFTTALLERTLLDGETGYRTHPTLTCGPYVLTAYADGVAEFDLNPRYKGNALGQKPTIPHITFRSMAQEEIIPALQRGEVQLVNKAAGTDLVGEGLALAAGDEAFGYSSYLRSGLGFISFNARDGILGDNAVRQAIACATDRDALMAATVGDNGQRADGYFGLGQWMYRLLNGTMPNPAQEPEESASAADKAAYAEAMARWEALQLSDIEAYPLDPAQAAMLLEEAGWNLNSAGEAFRPGQDTLRHRRDGAGNLTPLTLRLAYARGSAAGAALEEILVPALAEVGISLTVEAIPLAELLPQYYHNVPAEYDMYFLATNFSLVNDPSAAFGEEEGAHVWLTSGVADEELYEAAVAMRKTQPGDLLGYCTAWLAFQVRFAEVLPAMPIYSNIYFDFYPRVLQSYPIETSISWPQALDSAFLADYVPEETPTLEEEEIFE